MWPPLSLLASSAAGHLANRLCLDKINCPLAILDKSELPLARNLWTRKIAPKKKSPAGPSASAFGAVESAHQALLLVLLLELVQLLACQLGDAWLRAAPDGLQSCIQRNVAADRCVRGFWCASVIE